MSDIERLRNANDGWAITVWKDGGWKLWRTLDAKYAEGEPEWLTTLPGDTIQSDITALAKTGHPIQRALSVSEWVSARIQTIFRHASAHNK